ncbi:MAG: glycosyltransferase family 4 protein [Deltaproteobacteria bacterium]|nr:glycosyltransferase family 4 protein [Deltaproteobacteria bacterium]
MRIALVTPHTVPFSCGNSHLAERLRQGLVSRGHELLLFGIDAATVDSAVDFRPDIVHSLHAIKPARWLEELFSRISVPWVITLTGTDYNSPQEYGAEYEMLARQFNGARAIVVFHEEARSWVAEHFVEAADKLVVIAQGIDIRDKKADRSAVRRLYGVADGDMLFLMAAGLRPVKNICFALDFFCAVRRRCPCARLLLAGPVIDEAEALRISEKGRAVEGFTYIGEIAHQAVRDLMAAADVFLNVSLHEGMAGAMLEAMAEGLPVLASDTPGNRALVQPGRTGLLASLASRDSFIEAAGLLAADAGYRRALSAAARQSAAAFSELQEIDKYEKVYRSIAFSPCEHR